MPVAKHQDVRSGQFPAFWTFWERIQCFEALLLDSQFNLSRIPDQIRAFPYTLKPVNGTMAFYDSVFVKTRLLELSVYVGRKDKIPARLSPAEWGQYMEAVMGVSLTIEVEAMAIEARARP